MMAGVESLFRVVFLVLPILIALFGATMVIFPLLWWKMSRFGQQLKGLATTEEPAPGVLLFGRVMGVLLIAAAVGFYFFSQYILGMIFFNPGH